MAQDKRVVTQKLDPPSPPKVAPRIPLTRESFEAGKKFLSLDNDNDDVPYYTARLANGSLYIKRSGHGYFANIEKTTPNGFYFATYKGSLGTKMAGYRKFSNFYLCQ